MVSCTYLAHHELESVIIVINIINIYFTTIIIIPIIIIIMVIEWYAWLYETDIFLAHLHSQTLPNWPLPSSLILVRSLDSICCSEGGISMAASWTSCHLPEPVHSPVAIPLPTINLQQPTLPFVRQRCRRKRRATAEVLKCFAYGSTAEDNTCNDWHLCSIISLLGKAVHVCVAGISFENCPCMLHLFLTQGPAPQEGQPCSSACTGR